MLSGCCFLLIYIKNDCGVGNVKVDDVFVNKLLECITKRILFLQSFQKKQNQCYSEHDEEITFLLHKYFIIEQFKKRLLYGPILELC